MDMINSFISLSAMIDPYYRIKWEMWCYGRVLNLLWSNFIQDTIRERAFSSWLAFLHNDETCSRKFNSWSTLTPSNFSYLLLLTVSLSIFIWKLFLVLFMSKWFLSGFAFIQLSWNHCHRLSIVLTNLIRTSEIFKPVQYGVLSSA